MFDIKAVKFGILRWATDSTSVHYFHEQIGMISVAWALLEMSLDRLNAYLINLPGAEAYEQSLPVSLSRKLKFIRKAHHNLPTLLHLEDSAISIVERIEALKEKRHDLIHGFALTHPPSGLRDLERFHFEGRNIKKVKSQYSNADLRLLLNAIHQLGKDVIGHYIAVIECARADDDSSKPA